MHALFALTLAALAAVVALGAVRLYRAIRTHCLRRLDADYRAAALVVEAKRELRAGQHRAAERGWGRAA